MIFTFKLYFEDFFWKNEEKCNLCFVGPKQTVDIYIGYVRTNGYVAKTKLNEKCGYL